MEFKTSKDLADRIMQVADERKARDIELIDVGDSTAITDYFVICSGTSSTHIRGIADEVLFKLKEDGRVCPRVEGYESAKWILLDFLDVVVHIFLEEERAYYNIERLWKSTSSGRN